MHIKLNIDGQEIDGGETDRVDISQPATNPTTPMLTQEEFNIGLSKAFAGMEFFDPLKLRNAYAAALAEIARMKNEGWIPCSERLPGEQGQDSEDVLCFINGHCALTDYEARKGGAWGMRIGFYDAEKQAFRVPRIDAQVTHWQPLPSPPSKNED